MNVLEGAKKYSGAERRQYKRIRKHFIAKVKELSDDASVEPDSIWNMVTIQNIGAGGALFNYVKELKLGSLVDMKINFPVLSNPIVCRGKILRIERPNQGNIFQIAAIFTEISDIEKNMIDNAAEDFFIRKPSQIEP